MMWNLTSNYVRSIFLLGCCYANIQPVRLHLADFGCFTVYFLSQKPAATVISRGKTSSQQGDNCVSDWV